VSHEMDFQKGSLRASDASLRHSMAHSLVQITGRIVMGSLGASDDEPRVISRASKEGNLWRSR
jgi:hypothetical protein